VFNLTYLILSIFRFWHTVVSYAVPDYTVSITQKNKVGKIRHSAGKTSKLVSVCCRFRNQLIWTLTFSPSYGMQKQKKEGISPLSGNSHIFRSRSAHCLYTFTKVTALVFQFCQLFKVKSSTLSHDHWICSGNHRMQHSSPSYRASYNTESQSYIKVSYYWKFKHSEILSLVDV
jgi:hypothetical protein